MAAHNIFRKYSYAQPVYNITAKFQKQLPCFQGRVKLQKSYFPYCSDASVILEHIKMAALEEEILIAQHVYNIVRQIPDANLNTVITEVAEIPLSYFSN